MPIRSAGSTVHLLNSETRVEVQRHLQGAGLLRSRGQQDRFRRLTTFSTAGPQPSPAFVAGVARLTHKEQALLNAYYVECLSLADMQARFGLTEEEIRAALRAVKDQLLPLTTGPKAKRPANSLIATLGRWAAKAG
jgi:hypothetical protein